MGVFRNIIESHIIVGLTMRYQSVTLRSRLKRIVRQGDMLYRAHDRSHFYKYMTSETAIKVISSQSLRWSSPLKFNDPFDHQIGFSFPFTGEEIGEALLKEMELIIFGGKVSFKEPTQISAIAMRLSAEKENLPKDNIIKDFAGVVEEIAGNMDDLVDNLHAAVQKHMTHSRVLCVTEKNDNVVMWSHYADEHRGVVLELRCIDEIDNTLLAACKVKYSRQFPSFPSLDSFVKHLTGEEPLDLPKLSWEIAFTKHEDWSYEKEWRVHIPLLREPPGNGYSLYNEDPRVFGKVYLGCRIPDSDAARVTATAKEYIPHAKVLKGKRSRTAFALIFEEV